MGIQAATGFHRDDVGLRMIITGVDPHGLRLARSGKATFLIKGDRFSVCSQHVHMQARISLF
jgi:hypothetical protein